MLLSLPLLSENSFAQNWREHVSFCGILQIPLPPMTVSAVVKVWGRHKHEPLL